MNPAAIRTERFMEGLTWLNVSAFCSKGYKPKGRLALQGRPFG